MIRREAERLFVEGGVTLANVTRWREAGIAELDRNGLVVDLAGISDADSSALSLLLEWRRAARERGFDLRFANLPENMKSLAQVYGVLELIPLV